MSRAHGETGLGSANISLEKKHKTVDYSLGKGFTVIPPDSLFKMNLSFYMQNMISVNFNDTGITDADFQVKRLRFRFQGYMFTPKLTYNIQIGFSRHDTRESPPSSSNILQDAMIYYYPVKNWGIGIGQTKLQTTRNRLCPSPYLQLVSRSLVNTYFHIDRDYGIFARYENDPLRKVGVSARVSVTSGEGRNWKMASNGGLAYTGLVRIFPLGRFKNEGEKFESDLERETKPRLMLAGAYSANLQATRVNGQWGDTFHLGQTRDIHSAFADLGFKYSGFSFYTDYMARFCNDPIVYGDPETPSLDNSQVVFTGHGVNFQSGYLFKKNWEIALRVSQIYPDKKIQSHPSLGYKSEGQYTIGLNKFFFKNAVKAQMDASYNEKNIIAGVNYSDWQVRFMLQLAL